MPVSKSRFMPAFALVVYFICTPTGCNAPKKLSESVMINKSIALTIQKSEVDVSSLKIRAKLTNNCPRDVYYVRHLCGGWADDGAPIPESTPVYRVVTDDGVGLIRSFIPVPEDIDLEVIQYPLFALLKSGQSIDINIDLPLPTYPYTPYDFEEFDKESAKPAPLAWSLEIGYIEGSVFLAAEPEEVTTTTGEKGMQVFALDHSTLQSVTHSSSTTIPVLMIPN